MKPLFCDVGDIVEFVRHINCGSFDDCTESIAKGDRYKAVDLVGSGWDLERESGNGPKHLRILNSQMEDYVLRVQHSRDVG